MAVPISATKRSFLAAINLNLNNPEQCRVYDTMMSEAGIRWDELIRNRTTLIDPRKPPPYRWADIRGEAKDMAVRQIIQSASPVSRPYFVIGDWVILWCLYNFFRNRDGRRDHPTGNTPAVDNADAREIKGLSIATKSSQAGRQFYDMIRDRFY